MAWGTDHKPQAINDLLKVVVERYSLSDKIKEAEVPDLWIKVVGEKIASKVKVTAVENGRLFLATSSSTWRAEILLRSERIIKEINDLVGKDLIIEIIIR